MAWLDNWKYRRKITIDNTNIDSDLTHFPVPIVLGTSVGLVAQDVSDIFDELNSESKKIAITKADGTSQLYGEIEHWDSVNEKAVIWTSSSGLDILSENTTDLYLYYDSNREDNTDYIGDTGDTVAQNVWNSDFAARYGMAQDPSGGAGCIIDSTVNANHGSPGGSMTSADLVDGNIGKAIEFDGVNDGINIGPVLTNETQFAFGAFVKPTTAPNEGFIVTFGDHTYNVPRSMLQYKTGEILQLFIGDGSDNIRVEPTDIFSVDSWMRVFGIRDGDTGYLYTNGSLIGQGANVSIGDSIDDDGYIGQNQEANGFFDGLISDVQIWDAAPTEAWIKADYHAQTDNLITFSSTEEIVLDPYGIWTNRKKIIIDHTKIDEDLTHFPVLITLSGTDAEDIITEVGSNDKKIAIALSGGTQLYCEIEQWDTINNKITLWASRSDWTISSTEETVLYLYYDGAQDDNTTYIGYAGDVAAQNVWDSNFVAVYHMAQDPSGGAGCILDSTSNSNDGTPAGSMTSGDLVDGEIGKAIDFTGTGYINLPDVLDNAQGSIEINLNLNSFNSSGYNPVFMVDSNTGDRIRFFNFDGTTTYWIYSIQIDSGTTAEIKNYPWTLNAYNTHTITYDIGVTFKAYDGVTLIGSVACPTGTVNFPSPRIGRTPDHYDPAGYLDGQISEIRISDVVRLPAWIKATNASLTNLLLTYDDTESLTWIYSGYLKQEGIPVNRTVRLHDRATGDIIDEVQSDPSTGYFELFSYIDTTCYAVFIPELGDDYNMMVRDKIGLVYAGYG
jgi:hypothetical protein